MYAIEAHHLSRQFGQKVILKDVSFQLEAGRIHGLVGDNGSGKSVLLKCLCGILPCDSGKVMIQGREIKPGKGTPPVMGIVIEHPGFLGSMSGWGNLKYLAGIRGIATDEKIKEVLACVGLADDAGKQVRKYSLGMRQKLAIAQAIMEDPDVFIMDEPFNGLDKASVGAMRQLFSTLRARGKTFLLVSHHASDIDGLCDDVYEIEHGSVALHTPNKTKKEVLA